LIDLQHFFPLKFIFHQQIGKNVEAFSMILSKNLSQNISFFMNDSTLFCFSREGIDSNHLFFRKCLPHKPIRILQAPCFLKRAGERKTKTSFLRANKGKFHHAKAI
jgi:hypothetical protein